MRNTGLVMLMLCQSNHNHQGWKKPGLEASIQFKWSSEASNNMKETINSEEDNLNKIKSVVDELKREEVQAIYLFGSHAKGNAGPTSDIDICVITRKNIPQSAKEKIMSNSSRHIDISLFWDLPPVIRFRVFQEGKPLYTKDELLLQRIKVDTVKSYLDIQPMIKRYCTHVLRVSENV